MAKYLNASGITYLWQKIKTTFKPKQTPVSDPAASSSTSTTFISNISQDANGVITVTKKTVPVSSDTKVTQTNTTSANYHRLLMSDSTSDNTLTEGAKKCSSIYAKPSQGIVFANYFYGSLHHSRLQWGGPNTSGKASIIDAATMPFLATNRIAFLPPQDIEIEYSRDGGSTWTTVTTSDSNKTALVTPPLQAIGLRIGNYTGNVPTSDTPSNNRLRVTLTARQNVTYFLLHNIILNITTNGAGDCKALIEYANNTSGTLSFSQLGTYDISGWSGWNSIPIGYVAFGGANSQTNQWRKIRITIYPTSQGSTSNPRNLSLLNIAMLGSTCWGITNNLALHGHIYNFDSGQNVTFPKDLSLLGENNLWIGSGGHLYTSYEVQQEDEYSILNVEGEDGMNILSNGFINLRSNINILLNPGGKVISKSEVQAPIFTASDRMNSTNGFFQTSDLRKKDVKGEVDLSKAYDLIDKCQTIIYTLKDSEQSKEQIGLIAQEIREFFPEVIYEDEDGMLSLDYSRLTVVIFRVLKDLIRRVDKLEAK